MIGHDRQRGRGEREESKDVYQIPARSPSPYKYMDHHGKYMALSCRGDGGRDDYFRNVDTLRHARLAHVEQTMYFP